MSDHDVVIVGAGPVGLLLACLLAQEGIDVVVCERRLDVDDRSRAIGIHPPGLQTLDAVGLGERARAQGLQLDGGEVLCDGRTLASLDFPPARRVLILPQDRTDALLRGRLAELSGDALRRGHTVRGIRPDDDRVHLTVAVDDASGPDMVSAQRELTASVVVAADGVRSGIRDSLGIGWRARAGTARYLMIDVPDASGGARAQLHCAPGGLVESFPLPGGRRRWVALDGREERDRSAPAAEMFRDAIRARTGITPDIPDGERPVAFRARQHLAARTVQGRVILLGDAAHEVSPIGGQGMNLGWSDALRVASAIDRMLRGGRADLRGIEGRTRRAASAAQRRSRFYMSMGRPSHGLPLHARNAVIRVLGLAPLRGSAAGLITMRGI
ncbi:FAD-dependent oxidoreductase [Microbacterium alcoholitolerans]|uniref:FAD-dependent oxidoreductase n=1 Tax=unclassified Microbacterium TaxID=2609290 RepID=UPI003D1776A5